MCLVCKRIGSMQLAQVVWGGGGMLHFLNWFSSLCSVCSHYFRQRCWCRNISSSSSQKTYDTIFFSFARTSWYSSRIVWGWGTRHIYIFLSEYILRYFWLMQTVQTIQTEAWHHITSAQCTAHCTNIAPLTEEYQEINPYKNIHALYPYPHGLSDFFFPFFFEIRAFISRVYRRKKADSSAIQSLKPSFSMGEGFGAYMYLYIFSRICPRYCLDRKFD